MGKSIVIDYPADIARISTSNADIVDASPVTGREVLVQGKSFGTVTLVVWSKAGQRNFYNITVEQNLEPLRNCSRKLSPTKTSMFNRRAIRFRSPAGSRTKDIADRATALATPFAKTVVNNLQVSDPGREADPVAHQVRRTGSFRVHQFAVNLVSTGATNTIGGVSTGQFAAPPLLPALGGGRPASTFTISQRAEYFRLPAGSEPGGVHPGPGTAQPVADLGRADAGHQRWQGSQLPGRWRISHPRPAGRSEFRRGHHSVSRIRRPADLHAEHHRATTTFACTSSRKFPRSITPTRCRSTVSPFPRLSSRKMETNVELGEGQSFVIAGLIDKQVTETLSRIPVLSSLPILGNLFKSKSYQQERYRADRDGHARDHDAVAAGRRQTQASDAAPLPGAGHARFEQCIPGRLPKREPNRSARMRNGRTAR